MLGIYRKRGKVHSAYGLGQEIVGSLHLHGCAGHSCRAVGSLHDQAVPDRIRTMVSRLVWLQWWLKNRFLYLTRQMARGRTSGSNGEIGSLCAVGKLWESEGVVRGVKKNEQAMPVVVASSVVVTWEAEKNDHILCTPLIPALYCKALMLNYLLQIQCHFAHARYIARVEKRSWNIPGETMHCCGILSWHHNFLETFLFSWTIWGQPTQHTLNRTHPPAIM